MSAEAAAARGIGVLAEVGAHGNVAGPDNSLQSQPSRAIGHALGKAGLAVADLDLIEINEAFASVVLQSMRDLGISDEKVNVNGGAIAIGHPIGASGAGSPCTWPLSCGGAGRTGRRGAVRRAAGRAVRCCCACPRRPGVTEGAIERALSGDGRALARLVSLAENGGPGLRAVMKALAPLTGPGAGDRADRRPGVGKSTVTAALVGAYRAREVKVGVLAVDPTSPFSGGALLGDRVRMQDHATDPGCSSGPWPAGATSAGWRPPPRRHCGCWTRRASAPSWSRPWGWGRRRWRSPPWPTPPWCWSRRGWGTRSRRPRRASWRRATSSWSTRATTPAPRRRCGTCAR